MIYQDQIKIIQEFNYDLGDMAQTIIQLREELIASMERYDDVSDQLAELRIEKAKAELRKPL